MSADPQQPFRNGTRAHTHTPLAHIGIIIRFTRLIVLLFAVKLIPQFPAAQAQYHRAIRPDAHTALFVLPCPGGCDIAAGAIIIYEKGFSSHSPAHPRGIAIDKQKDL